MNPVEEFLEYEKTAANNPLFAKMKKMFQGGNTPMNRLVNAVKRSAGQLPNASNYMPGHLHDLIEQAGDHGFARRIGGKALADTADNMGSGQLPGKVIGKIVDAAIDQENAKEMNKLRDESQRVFERFRSASETHRQSRGFEQDISMQGRREAADKTKTVVDQAFQREQANNQQAFQERLKGQEFSANRDVEAAKIRAQRVNSQSQRRFDEQQQQRQADLGLRNNVYTAGALAAGTGLLAGAAYGVHKLHDAVTYHSDFNQMMDANPYLQEHRERDPKYFNTAFQSARAAAPSMMKNPLIAGNLMHSMLSSSDRSGAGGVLAQAIQNETNLRRDRGMAMGPISFKPLQ